MNEVKEVLKAVSQTGNLKDYDSLYNTHNWDDVPSHFSWHETGKVNMAFEACDRHVLTGHGDKIALNYFDGVRDEKYSYLELQNNSNKVANVLVNDANAQKGDRAFIFMPRTPELCFIMLGIIKMGGICGPLFEAFMEGAIKDRLENSQASILFTVSELLSRVPLDELPDLKTVYVVDATEPFADPRIKPFAPLFQAADINFTPEWMDLEDPMLLCYTSGSTGKPKGIVHVHGAMTQQYQTAKWVLDFKDDDVYWCTADPGWVTGTVYGLLAPWLCGIEMIVVGGRFNADHWYQTLQDHKVTVWYSAPTAFRLLMSNSSNIGQYDLSSLRHICSVGEPLNPEVVRWGMENYQLRIHDTWWMTETGSQIICNYPCMDIRPGSMGKPIPGVEVAIIDNMGNKLPPYQMGNLGIKKGWPSMMRNVWGDPAKYASYFVNDEWYVSGDTAYYDEDGYYWYQGRIDDVINTSGERVGPFEIESKLLEHPAVAEAGVIGKPDAMRGEIVKAFIALNEGYESSEELKKELREFVKLGLAAHASPREFEFCESLPKTRSGKILRRVLKARELGLPTGDVSTME